jgi:hypothetical protein
MKTLFIEADIASLPADAAGAGWREAVAGATVEPDRARCDAELWVMPAGTTDSIDDRTVSAPMVRDALARVARSFDVVIVSTGSLSDRLSGKFVLSAADVGVLALRPSDRTSTVLTQLTRLRDLPRNGSVAAMRQALPGDPWLAVRT